MAVFDNYDFYSKIVNEISFPDNLVKKINERTDPPVQLNEGRVTLWRL